MTKWGVKRIIYGCTRNSCLIEADSHRWRGVEQLKRIRGRDNLFGGWWRRKPSVKPVFNGIWVNRGGGEKEKVEKLREIVSHTESDGTCEPWKNIKGENSIVLYSSGNRVLTALRRRKSKRRKVQRSTLGEMAVFAEIWVESAWLCQPGSCFNVFGKKRVCKHRWKQQRRRRQLQGVQR